ncbi:hypothetical protein ACJ73_06059 [Blastomyces percursus]|uniref:Chitin-binding type-4 domain-containing protein n=1 Tax=Blastomyces percursus TaxID=1658174 RepID=A0A1J9QQU9_9EURO|nr:hypothetical protein ACJ73_06059 [Blastomyces percursus]
MCSSIITLQIISLATLAWAHMQLYNPPPFGASNNPHLTTSPDPYLDYPYNCCGRTTPFPCKGYLDHLDTPQGQPVASWPAGSVQNFSLTGTGNHYGGSCQVGFSTNKGATWRVVKSFEGNCPHRHGGTDPAKQTFDFRVPADTPVGVQVFAWTWINREREFNMLCAAVEIARAEGEQPGVATVRSENGNSNEHSRRDAGECVCTCGGGGASGNFTANSSANNSSSTAATGPETVSFNERPGFLFANIDNECQTPETDFELKYPDPGPDVAEGDGEYELKLPEPVDKCN